ncbi:HlyD family type I secretion periplasmic adaptor subunit [Devosia sp. PTR5]|uniref:Membrane fusion protein (MFP) family protein n=1 Tax=Devosia oryzisoli TaxID=2774138 RepID=A0A927FVB1_9HYPH|nr:HlyD family type I secretion periplasmic adaptor subunit [Devosia oryzisoli]MBD8066995.1 HlyD family type I secretion periplasmic adaptor subunit [Devosia oryzisoli]
MNAEVSSGDLPSLRRHGLLAIGATVAVFGALIGWAATTHISGAIVAPGTLVVQDNAKRVQHSEGGIVSNILVRNDEHVEAGQLLAILDQTAIAANLAIINSQLKQAFAREGRLAAQIEGKETIKLSDAAVANFSAGEMDALLTLEQRALSVRRATRAGRIEQLNEQINQLQRQSEGLKTQQEALEDQLQILKSEIADFDTLYEDRLVALSRGTALDKEMANVKGQLGQVVSAIAQGQASASERALQIEQVKDEYLTDALAELQDVRQVIAEAGQRKIAEEDRLTRTEIRAPQSGTVHESVLHTVGGVAAAGETLMLVVPSDEPLVANVRVDPIDIDKVVAGQEVVLRLPGLNPRKTPELFASVDQIAPDASRDAATGAQFYSARITLPDDQVKRLPPGTELVPGMPVQSYVQLGDRTVLSYILQPLVDQLRLAMREE